MYNSLKENISTLKKMFKNSADFTVREMNLKGQCGIKSAIITIEGMCGKPVIVIKDGRILQSAMKKLRLTTEDLSVRLRQQGIFSIEDVQYCIVETNGEVSVLEKPEKRKPSAEDFGLKIKDNKIETVVVSNGKILENSLNLCKKEKGYVKNILQKKNIKQSNVFLMTLDALGN